MEKVKEFLEQYISAGRTIAALNQEKEQLFELATRATSGEYRNSDLVGRNASRIADVDKQIQADIDRLSMMRYAVQGAVNAIEDVRIRDVMVFRYICGLNTEQIAKRMHYSERWVKYLHKEGLEKIKSVHPTSP